MGTDSKLAREAAITNRRFIINCLAEEIILVLKPEYNDDGDIVHCYRCQLCDYVLTQSQKEFLAAPSQKEGYNSPPKVILSHIVEHLNNRDVKLK